MRDFKTYLMQYLIEGEINVTHKENIPSDPEEYRNLLNRFLEGEHVPSTGIEARNLTKHMNERNVGTNFIDEFAGRLLGGRHKIKSRTHATEAMVGLAQHAHRDDEFFDKHKEGLLAQGGVISKEAEKEIPLKVMQARTGGQIFYKKSKEPGENKIQRSVDTRSKEQKEREIDDVIRKSSAEIAPRSEYDLERGNYDPRVADIEDYGVGQNFYKVGSRVNVPQSGFRDITSGTVVHSYRRGRRKGPGGLSEPFYDIRYELPKGHEDAYDENGEPDHIKYGFVSTSQLDKHNKKKDVGSIVTSSIPKDELTKVDPNTEVTFSHESVHQPSPGAVSVHNIIASSKYGSHHVGTIILHSNGNVTGILHPFGMNSKPGMVSTTSGSIRDSKERIISAVNQIKHHYMAGGHIPTDAIDENGLNIPMNRGGHEKGENYVWRPTDETAHNVVGKVVAVHSRRNKSTGRNKSVVELVDKNGKRHFAHSDEISPQEEKRPDAEFSMAR